MGWGIFLVANQNHLLLSRAFKGALIKMIKHVCVHDNEGKGHSVQRTAH